MKRKATAHRARRPRGAGGALRDVRRQRERRPGLEVRRQSTGRHEMVLGGAIESSMTIPGLTTKCENFLYKLTIKN